MRSFSFFLPKNIAKILCSTKNFFFLHFLLFLRNSFTLCLEIYDMFTLGTSSVSQKHEEKDSHMKHYILYNPAAGNGTCQKAIEALDGLYEGETERLDMTQIRDYASFFSRIRTSRGRL